MKIVKWNEKYTASLEKALGRNVIVADSKARAGDFSERLIQNLFDIAKTDVFDEIVDDPELTRLYVEKYNGTLPTCGNKKVAAILCIYGENSILGAY